jgi:hypothetical protein
VGGAPPPPQDFAPQGPKNPEKFDRFRSGFGGLEGPEDQSPAGGGVGAPNHYPRSAKGGQEARLRWMRRWRDPLWRPLSKEGGG